VKGVILAAGRGTRLKGLGKELPKVLLNVGERTCLEHIVLGMKSAGITEFIVVIGHLGEVIKERYGDGESLGVNITYVTQDLREYGTGKAVALVEHLVQDEPFILSYGDIIIDPANYKALLDVYERNNSIVESVNWVDDPKDGAAVYFDESNRVEQVIEKPPAGTAKTNWNNAGLYVYKPVIFEYLRKTRQSSRGEYELTSALKLMLEDNVPVTAYKIQGYWQDIGRPEDLKRISQQLIT